MGIAAYDDAINDSDVEIRMNSKEHRDPGDYDEAVVERRVQDRVRLTSQATIHGMQSFSGLSWDVSKGGICVAIGEELPVGTLVEVEFTLPGFSEKFESFGEVRWAEPLPAPDETRSWGHGIEFLKPDPRVQNILDSFVEEMSQAEEVSEVIDED